MTREKRQCEICQASDSGKVYVNKYTFRYGRYTGTERYRRHQTRYVKKNYKIADTPEAAYICNVCVNQAQRAPFRTARNVFLGGAALGAVAFLVSVAWGKADLPINAVVAVLGVIVSILVAIAIFVSPIYALIHVPGRSASYERIAQELAIRLRKGKLQKEGWDTFWTGEEYKGLGKPWG